MDGKTILKHYTPENSLQELLDVSTLMPGAYVLSFINEGVIESVKIIKE